jgi:predicted O-methyltransferase YrrM
MLKNFVRKIFQVFPSLVDINLRLSKFILQDSNARHVELSGLLSLDDSPGCSPSKRLLDLSAMVIEGAQNIELTLLHERKASHIVHCWPGEHYKLLSSLVRGLGSKRILEVGTYTGLSALAMIPELNSESKLVTVDIIPWDQIFGTYLIKEDFEDGRFSQIIADFGNMNEMLGHEKIIREADVIFVDGPKDGVFERKFICNLISMKLTQNPIIIFDDIRVWNMLEIWREIDQPKLDLVGFGHWTGTGLVDWCPHG